MKKLLSVIASVLVFACLALCVFADDYGNPIDSGECGKDGDNVIWTMYDSGTLVISGEGEMEDYDTIIEYTCAPYEKHFPKIRKIVVEYGVTSIGDNAFYYNEYSSNAFIDFSIADSVTRIGNYAFCGLSFRNYDFMPDSVTSIGSNIMYFTNWYDSLPDGLLYFENLCVGYKGDFPNNARLDIVIKDGTRAVSSDLFYSYHGNDTIKSVYVPATVNAFEGNPFISCTDVKVTVDKNNPYMYVDSYGVIYNADRTKLLAAPSTLYLGSYTVPETVTEICDGAFYGCQKLYGINFGKGVKYIGEKAFYNCDSLSYVTIPGNVKIIDILAFNDCDNISRVDMLYGVEVIYDGAFGCCDKLTEINLPNSLTTLSTHCFGDLKALKTIDIPNSVTSIAERWQGTDIISPVFIGSSSLETVYLPYDSGSYFDYHHFGEVEYPNMKTIYFKDTDASEIENSIKWIRDFFPETTQFLPLYVGSKINSYLNTDIVARINGAPIRSYNIDGYTVIIAEDLKQYGFNVHFDGEKRILYVDDVKGEITSTYTDPEFSGKVGDEAGDVLYTDIDTYVGGLPVKSYNIGGYTAIYITDLERFGTVIWNEQERKIFFER